MRLTKWLNGFSQRARRSSRKRRQRTIAQHFIRPGSSILGRHIDVLEDRFLLSGDALVEAGQVFGTSGSILTHEVDTYTQLAGGTLSIEIGSATSFDQVHVVGAAALDGTLRIELENGFLPDVGTTFDFLTFGSQSGAFAAGEHLYGFASGSRYFEVVAQADRLTLVTREFAIGNSNSFVADSIDEANQLGEFLNQEYFAAAEPSVTVSGTLDLDVYLHVSGSFHFEWGGLTTVTVATGIPANAGQAAEDAIDPVRNAFTTDPGVTVAPDFSTISGLDVAAINVGISDAEVFIGVNGPYDANDPSSDSLGLQVSDVDLGLVLMVPTLAAVPGFDQLMPKFYALKANVNSAALVGIPGLTATATGVEININGGSWSEELAEIPGIPGPVVDFEESFSPDGYEVGTGAGNASVFIDHPGDEIIGASASNVTLDIGGYVQVSGGLSFEMGGGQTVSVATGIPANLGQLGGAVLGAALNAIPHVPTEVGGLSISNDLSHINGLDVETIKLGISDASAFIGVNGGSDNAIGLQVSNVDLGLVLMTPTLAELPGFEEFMPKFYALKGNVDSAGLVGIPGITATASGIEININGGEWSEALAEIPGIPGPVVDFDASFLPDGYEVETGNGNESVFIDHPGDEIIGASASNVTLDIGGYVQVSGGLSFEMGGGETVSVATGIPANLGQLGGAVLGAALDAIPRVPTEVGGLSISNDLSHISGLDVETIKLGISDASAFIGVNGGSGNAIGLQISDVDLGMVLMTPTLAELPGFDEFLPKFYALKGSVDSAGLVGIPGITATASGIEININGGEWSEALTEIPGIPGPVVDFEASFSPDGYEVETGNGNESVIIDHPGDGIIGVSAENVTVDIGGYVHVSGGLAFEMGGGQTVSVATGIPANLGELGGAVLGEALNALPRVPTEVGGLSISDDLSHINGLDVETIKLGISNANAFIGVNGPGADGIGLQITGADFGMVMMTPTLGELPGFEEFVPKFYAISASVESAAMIGVPGVTATANDVTFDLNGGIWSEAFGSIPGPAVDFAASFPDTNGYLVETGPDGEGVLLEYSTHFLAAQFVGEVAIQDVLAIDGQFSFTTDGTSVEMTALGDLSLADDLLTFQVDAVLTAHTDGLAARMKLALDAEQIPGVSLDGSFAMFVNTTGADQTINIPDEFPATFEGEVTDESGQRSVTVSANAPTFPVDFVPGNPIDLGNLGQEASSTDYFVVMGSGHLIVSEVFDLEGAFRIGVGGTNGAGEVSVEANARLDLELNGTTMFSFDVEGGMKVSQDGLVGVIDVSLASGFELPEFGVAFDVDFQLQLNSTATSISLAGAEIAPGGLVFASGSLGIGALSLSGDFAIEVSPDHYLIGMVASADVFGSTLQIEAEAGLYADGIVFSGGLTMDGGNVIVSPISNVTIFGDFTLSVNTTPQEHDSIPAGTAEIDIAANVNLFGFVMTGSIEVAISENGLSLDVPEANPLTLDFFGFTSIHVFGHLDTFNDDVSFSFTGGAGIKVFDPDIFGIEGNISLTFADSGFAGRISGSVGEFGVRISAGGDIVIGGGVVSCTIFVSATLIPAIHIEIWNPFGPNWHINIPEVRVSADAVFKLGTTTAAPEPPPPPELATLIDGHTLRLNIGVDKAARGSAYEDVDDESYVITRVGAGTLQGEMVKVKALGTEQIFDNVTDIVVNDTQDGNDFIKIGSTVQAAVSINAEVVATGNNHFVTGAGFAVIDGGSGLNSIEIGSGGGVYNVGTSAGKVIDNSGGNLIVNASGFSDYFFDDGGLTYSTPGEAAPASLIFEGVEQLNLTGGEESTAFTIGGWHGTGTLTGGGDASSISSTQDVDFTLSDDSLTQSNGAAMTLVNIVDAQLTAIGANAFTVTDWTGTGSLKGADGHLNQIVSSNDVDFTLTDTQLSRGDLGDLQLASIERATLTGGAGGNLLTVSGWTGSTTFDGDGGTDKVVTSNDVNFALSDALLTRSGLGNVTLTSVEAVELTGGNANNTFTISGWNGSATIDGAGGSDSATIQGLAAGTQYTVSDISVAFGTTTVAYAGLESLLLNAGANGDTFNVSSTHTETATTINMGPGTNTANVGNVADKIQGTLTLTGSGSDTFNLDDTGNSSNENDRSSVMLNSNTVSGLGIAGISYTGLRNINLRLNGDNAQVFVDQLSPAAGQNLINLSITNDGDNQELVVHPRTPDTNIVMNQHQIVSGPMTLAYNGGFGQVTVLHPQATVTTATNGLGNFANVSGVTVPTSAALMNFNTTDAGNSLNLENAGLRIVGKGINLNHELRSRLLDIDSIGPIRLLSNAIVNESFNADGTSLDIDGRVEAGSATWNVGTSVRMLDTANVTGVFAVNADTLLADKAVTAGGLVWIAPHGVELNGHANVTGTMGDGATGLLEIVSVQGQIDFAGQDFHVANGHLILSAGLGFTDTIRSEARVLTATNFGTGSLANITVRELNGLDILDAGLASGGVYSQNGAIDLRLASQDSLLTLASGIISTGNSGQTIRLTADDFDFTSGENQISGTGPLLIRSTHDEINYRLGSAGENSVGEDQSPVGNDATMHLGVRDFAALGDNFSLVQIGHAFVNGDGNGNEMTFGDIEDDPVIKLGFMPRSAKAALRNRTQFFADTMTIAGDVQAPADRVEFHGHRALVSSKNLHAQLQADDSGVTAQTVVFNLAEQLQHGGWIIGQNRVEIDVTNSNGTRPYFSFPTELVSLKSDVGSRIESLNPNSVIDIDTTQSIQVAGLIEVHGAGSLANIASDTKLTVLEGGLVAGRDDNNVLTLDAGLLLSINPGGAVIAGARFDDVNGTPVAMQTGAGADAILNSPHELFIGGTVTTSDQMQLNSGAPQFDYTDYFNGLADVDPEHPLIGHSQYGILLTGTLTTLAANTELKLESDADVIIRGNINVFGANSDLVVQSDRFVYVEGFIDVKDNARILGGIETNGTLHNDADPILGSSVYVATTSRTITRDAGSSIDIRGAKDVDLFGAIVAGGTIGQNGVMFSGPSSSISVTAGEQVFLDTGLLASGTVTVTSGTPSAEDTVAALFPGQTLPEADGSDRLSLVITTAGGITTSGSTTDNSGGGIVVNAAGNIEVLGSLNAGANITQQFDLDGNFLGETATYSDEPAALTINTTGRAFLGGHTLNQGGDLVQTGTYLRAAHAITVNGGTFRTGESLLVHAASELTVNDPIGSITLTSDQNASVLGLFVAGGRIDTVRDANGGYLGRIPMYFNGDSVVTLQAGGTIEIGQDIVAGQRIDLIGGTGSWQEPATLGPGLTVQGSGRLITLRPNSEINLNAPGEVVILPPGHINEIEAQGFIHTNDGKLASDVTFAISVDRVDFSYSGTVTLTIEQTADNTGIADLVGDLQAALEAGNFSIVESDNPDRVVGDTFTELDDDPSTGPTDPDVKVKLRNGKLVLTSPYSIVLNPTELLPDTSGAAALQTALGFNTTSGPLTSSRLYAIDAAQPGSTVNIGAPFVVPPLGGGTPPEGGTTNTNGKLTIGGKVRAYSAINLYSGTSPDGVDIDLGPTGVLETVNGSIAFHAGQYGDIRGSIIANGTGSDIVLDAEQTLRIRGKLFADDDILLSGGSQLVAHEVSVQIDGTSTMNSTGGGGDGEIVITGYNDLVFDGVVGTGSNQLARLELNAVHGNLTIPKTSGWIESDALIFLKGAVVDVQGVVRSTSTTADATDYEITIDASDRAIINGDLQLTGSLNIDADNLVEVFNTTIDIVNPTQKVRFSGGDVRFGKASTDENGDPVQLGALVTAVDRIEFGANGLVEIGSGSVIATSGANSVIDLHAGSLAIAGSLLAGATVDEPALGESGLHFDGASAGIVINDRDTVSLGGIGIIDGVSQSVGGTLTATGDITIGVHGGVADVSFTMNELSSIQTVAATNEPPSISHTITISTDQDIQIYGTITALAEGGEVTIASGEMILVDGFVKADDLLSVTGGSDETDVGLMIQPFVFAIDADGNELTDANGDPIRVHGGTLTTNSGGTISLGAGEKLVLGGVIGEVHQVAGVGVPDASVINVTQGGDVLVMTTLNAADSVQFRTTNLTLAPGSVIQTRNSGGVVDLRASSQFLIGATPADGEPALIQADGLLHLAGGTLSLDGQIITTGSDSRMVINAVNAVTFFNQVEAADSLEVRAGVGANWTDEQLFGTVTVADLSGGDITVNGGTLTGHGPSQLLAGHDVSVIGRLSVGSEPVPVRRPIIVTTPQVIEVITGTRQVAIGTILVPEVTFVTTTVTEQVGTESVRVGSRFNTADVTLTQLGYSNGSTFRKLFVEGSDYGNDSIDWTRRYNPLTGNVEFISQSAPAAGTTFQALTDNQRSAVLVQLGYRPLYNASFANLVTHNTINGIPTDIAWHPAWEYDYSWASADTSYVNASGQFVSGPAVNYRNYNNAVTVQLPVDGWRDKFIRIPAGAESDILRVVSQGTPLTFTEDVGEFQDRALIQYTQDATSYVAQTITRTEYDPYSINADANGNVTWTTVTTDYDNSPARWRVSYRQDGVRVFSLTDGVSPLKWQPPEWTSAQDREYGNDWLGRNTNAPTGFYASTEYIGNLVTLDSGTYYDPVGRSDFGTYHPTTYQHIAIARDWDTALNSNVLDWSAAAGATRHDSSFAYQHLVHIRNATQNNAIRDSFPAGGRIWIGALYSSDWGWAQSSGGGVVFFTNPSQLTYTNWTPGEPSGDAGNRAIQMYGGNGEWNDIVVSTQLDQVRQTNSYWTGTDITDTYSHYTAPWRSNWRDLADRRLQLSYQLVTNPVDIYDLRPKFETSTVQIKVVTEKSVTQWQTENITEQQTILTTSRTQEDGTPTLQGAFDAPSIVAPEAITISAGNDVAIRAIVESTGIDQTLTVTAGRDVLLNGLVPDGADAGTLPAVAKLLTDGRITVTAGRDAKFGAASEVTVDADGVAESLSEVQLTAGRDIHFAASVTAAIGIEGHAGTSGIGSIIADINTELTTLGNQLVLTAGAVGGNIELPGTSLNLSTVDGVVTLQAPGGSISHSQSAITAKKLVARAATGITGNTVVTENDIQNSGSGDVSLINVGDVTFVNTLANANGAIDLTVFGNATVGHVTGGGDRSFLVTGQLAQTANTTIGGGYLTLNVANAGGTLNTAVTGLTLRTGGSGDVTVNNTTSQPLDLNVTVTDGGLTVITGGDLAVTNVVSLTNADNHDVMLTAGGQINIGYLNAGAFAGSEAEARQIRLAFLSGALRAAGFLPADQSDLTDQTYSNLDRDAARVALIDWLTNGIYSGDADAATKAGAEADRQLDLQQPIRSEGDVTLTAGGAIGELIPNDPFVDLIADTLTVVSGQGINGIETALNEITSINNSSGTVTLSDVDSRGDPNPGLSVVFVANANGSVSITVPGDLDVQRVQASGANSDVTLTSDGSLLLRKVIGVTTTVSAGHNLTLHADGDLTINSGFTAPNSVSFTTDHELTLQGATLNLSTNEAIFIQTNNSLYLKGLLESAKSITLISNRGDAAFEGIIRGKNGNPLESLTVIARGNVMRDGEFAGLFRFRSLINDATYYADMPELSAYSVVVDDMHQPVADFVELDLVPFTATEAPIVKHANGMDYFRDPIDQQLYLRLITGSGDLFYRPTDPASGLYLFTALNLTNNQFIPLLYSTTANPDDGTLYAADKTTVIDRNTVSQLETQVISVTDSAITSRLVPYTVKDQNGGKAVGTSIELDVATIGTVSNTVTFIAQGNVRTSPLSLAGPNSSITVISGEDLTTGNWQAQHITAQATGLFDASGTFATGTLTMPSRFTTTSGANPQTVSLTALGDITLNAPVSPTTSLLLHTGGAIVNLPSSITVSGPGNFIDLVTGSDLSITGSLSAIDGHINLSARGISQNHAFRTGGTLTISGNITIGNGVLTLDTTDTNSSVSGSVSGNGGIELFGQLDVNSLLNAGPIVVHNGAILGGTGTANGSVVVEGGGTLAPGQSPGVLTVTGDHTFESGSTFAIEVNGTTVGTQYDQLAVNGTVTIGSNVTLSHTTLNGFIPLDGNLFTIINNAGVDPIEGTFASLPDGSRIINFLGSGVTAIIDYDGGDGNDVVISIDTRPPEVFSMVLADSDPTRLTTVRFTVTFSEPVTGVDANDFLVDQTGLTGAAITGVSGSGATYTVAVASGIGEGTLSLDFDADLSGGVEDLSGNISINDFTAGATYSVDTLPPTVSSIVRVDNDPTNATSVRFTVTFREPVTGVGVNDFVVDQTGLAGASVTSVSGIGTTYTVTVDVASGDGTLSIDFDADLGGGVQDSLLNSSAADFTAGESYRIDLVPPTVVIEEVSDAPRLSAVGTLAVTFSETVTGVDIGDFELTRTPVAGSTAINVPLTAGMLSGGGSSYAINLSSVTGVEGTYRLTFKSSGTGVLDFVGNELSSGAFERWHHASTTVVTTGTIPNQTVTITDISTTPGLGNTNDGITLSLVPGSPNLLRVSYEAAPGFPGVYQDVPLTGVANVVINGGAGNDTVTIDSVNGLPPLTFTFNGGAGGNDVLHVTNFNNGFDAFTANYANVSDGNLQLKNNGVVKTTIVYTGLEPITIDGAPTEVIFNLPGTHDTDVSLLDIGGADGFMRLSSSTFEDTDFSIGAATAITINSNGGDDRVSIQSIDSGHAGVLIVNGGAGQDSLSAATAGRGLTLLGGAGNDTLSGSAFADLLDGGLGNDTLFAQDGDDSVTGGGGNDVLNGGLGTDTVVDTGNVNFTLTNTQLTGLGADTLTFIEQAILTGGTGNNTLNAAPFTLGPVSLMGGDGSDTLIGGSSADVLDGGNGSDTVSVKASGNFVLTGDVLLSLLTVNGGPTDSLFSIESVSLSGGTGNDTLDGSGFSGNLILNGVGGNDSIIGGVGNDVLYGGGGNDTLFGNSGNDIVKGQDGTDMLKGGDGNDVLYGDAGNDTMQGDNGYDTLAGGFGNDRMDGGIMDDSLDGGDGNDTMNGDDGNDTLQGGGLGADSLIGGEGNDFLNGNTDSDTLSGGNGNDTLLGGSHRDRLIGGAGNDFLDGDSDNDTLLGEGGNDTLLGQGGNDDLNGGDDNDFINAADGNDRILGGFGDDLILGGAGNDQIDGGSGNDCIAGQGGNDWLLGRDGNDSITGGAGRDIVLGGSGNDTVYGANGVPDAVTDIDTIAGQAGSDMVIGTLAEINEAFIFDLNLIIL